MWLQPQFTHCPKTPDISTASAQISCRDPASESNTSWKCQRGLWCKLESAVKPEQSKFNVSQSSGLVVHVQTICAMHRWSSGTTLLCFFLTISLPAVCRKTYSSSGLEKEPKEKDLIWTLATISAIIRNIFLSLGPNSYSANIYGPKSARNFSQRSHAGTMKASLVWRLQKISFWESVWEG